MPIPTLTTSYQVTSPAVNTSSLVSPSFTPTNGELVLVKVAADDSSLVIGLASGGSQTFVSQVSFSQTNHSPVRIFSALITGSPGSMTVTVAFSGSGAQHSMVVERWSNAQVAVTPAVVSGLASGAPSKTITTTANGSVVSWIDSDWGAATPSPITYRSGAIQDGFYDGSGNASYVAYFAYQYTDVAGSQTIGLTSPTGQNASMAGIEIQGVVPGVLFDAVGPSSTGTSLHAVTTLTWSHTCSTGNGRLLTVGLGVGANSDIGVTTSVTYNGTPMTSAAKVHTDNQTGGYVELFYLIAPATGTNTIIATASTAMDLIGGSVSFMGVDQSVPVSNVVTNFGSSTTPSLTVASASGNMVVSAIACGSGINSSGQTSQWKNNLNTSTGASNASQSTDNGAPSVPMSYGVINDWWGMIGVNVSAAGLVLPSIASVAWLTA